jgi:hypothetical protein
MKLRLLLLASAFLIGIIGFSGRNAPRSAAIASATMTRFDEIPKGVVLEGSASGIEELTAVSYDKDKNEFLINEKVKYKNPIGRKEFAQMLKALKEDDRIGVTLLEGSIKTYGKMGSGAVITALSETDKILGGLIYGIDHLLEGVKLPRDYKPRKAADRKIPVVAFSNLNGYTFLKKDGEYVCVGKSLDVTLIPLAEKKAEGGGHLPDKDKINEYAMEDSDRANLDHLRAYQNEYFLMAAFSKSVAAGEAAAFARWVRDSKVDNEALIKAMKQ